MNAIAKSIDHLAGSASSEALRVSPPVSGNELSIGTSFKAKSFRATELKAAMDPLVMVDHYVMTESTFGVHPHAGMSAVSLLFEDGEGRFHNRDSLGSNFDLQPGDLYWLKAGSGALHDEAPRPGSRIHGLQVFVNLRQSNRHDAPDSLLVRRADMPVISGDNYRVHVALGSSNGVTGKSGLDSSITILDGHLSGPGKFSHRINANRNVWIHAIDGDLTVSAEGSLYDLKHGDALTVSSPVDGPAAEIVLQSDASQTTHFALFDAEPLDEPYVQQGPLVMGSTAEIEAAQAAYAAGRFGTID
ncbi:pirin family protein [Congregibacter brevis]|uniref:Pirin family protein n=1 Tax=Congregibacter brevis TaxID=3081201 RepID=A0ABZ0IBR1_9GAMM|nr:pirin family protein [Congregibacter sp. IMCC45268]